MYPTLSSSFFKINIFFATVLLPLASMISCLILSTVFLHRVHNRRIGDEIFRAVAQLRRYCFVKQCVLGFLAIWVLTLYSGYVYCVIICFGHSLCRTYILWNK